eukprot:1159792-Pelagomonas_calceolata.AAC.14
MASSLTSFMGAISRMALAKTSLNTARMRAPPDNRLVDRRPRLPSKMSPIPVPSGANNAEGSLRHTGGPACQARCQHILCHVVLIMLRQVGGMQEGLTPRLPSKTSTRPVPCGANNVEGKPMTECASPA